MKKKDKQQPISASQAMKLMKEHCERIGIPFSQNQPPEGSASVRFMRKSKKGKKKKTAAKTNQDTSTQKDVPSYLERFNSKPLNDKVGKVFITSTKLRSKKANNS